MSDERLLSEDDLATKLEGTRSSGIMATLPRRKVDITPEEVKSCTPEIAKAVLEDFRSWQKDSGFQVSSIDPLLLQVTIYNLKRTKVKTRYEFAQEWEAGLTDKPAEETVAAVLEKLPEAVDYISKTIKDHPRREIEFAIFWSFVDKRTTVGDLILEHAGPLPSEEEVGN